MERCKRVTKRVGSPPIARLIVSVILCVAGAKLAALGQKEESQQPATPGRPAPSVLGVPCSSIEELGIDKQTNMRAALIRIGCGIEAPGQPGPASPALGPLGADAFPNVNTIT